MHSIIRSFKYLKGYINKVVISVLLTIIIAIFEVVSLLSIVPFLKLIFNDEELVKPKAAPNFSIFPVSNLGTNLKAHYDVFSYNISSNYSEKEILTFICIMVFATFLLKNIFLYIYRLTDRSIRYNVARDLRKNVYEKILKLPIQYFSEQRRGDILTRFSSDIEKVENTVLNGYSLLIKDPIMIMFYLGSLFVISTKLTLFIIVLLPVLGIIIGRISKTLKKKSGAYQTKAGELLSYIDETMFGARVIKAFTAEKYLNTRFAKENNELKQIRKRIFYRSMSASPVSETLGIGIVAIVLWYGGNLIIDNQGALTGAMLIAYLVLFSRLISPLKSLSETYSSLQDGIASSDRIDELLALDVEYEQLPQHIQPIPFNQSIELKNVNFQYPNSDQLVLNQLNLSIIKGEVTALVGQSGAGKSTIADILPRFYDVTGGEITIDGTPIKNIALENLRGLFSYVSQEAILFNDTVTSNIAFGVENVSKEDIIRAAKIANAHDFIINLENGYETNVGERGGKLSGGQRQRITIARAVLKNAEVLILDEATSALDTESEKLVQDAINRLLENRTAVVIAHRLSTIKNANKICVVDNGQIVEQGTHQELIQIKEGKYKMLTEMQSL